MNIGFRALLVLFLRYLCLGSKAMPLCHTPQVPGCQMEGQSVHIPAYTQLLLLFKSTFQLLLYMLLTFQNVELGLPVLILKLQNPLIKYKPDNIWDLFVIVAPISLTTVNVLMGWKLLNSKSQYLHRIWDRSTLWQERRSSNCTFLWTAGQGRSRGKGSRANSELGQIGWSKLYITNRCIVV